MNKIIKYRLITQTIQFFTFLNKLIFLVVAFFASCTTILKSVLRQTKKSNLAVIVCTLFTSILSAQGELKITATNVYNAAATPTSGLTITVYDEGGTTLLHTYTNVSAAQIVNPTDWGGVLTDRYQIWYPNSITSFATPSNTTTAARLLSVDQWGTATLTALDFFQAINMDINATDAPTFAVDAQLNNLFYNCSSLVDAGNNIITWNTANVKNLANAFRNVDLYNPNGLGNWDVGNVTDFRNMFLGSVIFNDATINNWNISQNTGTDPILMSGMFWNAEVFNSPLEGWETNANSTMAYVTTMRDMFINSYAFNQNIGDWNVGRVTTFFQMFYGAAGIMAFNNGDASGAIGTGMRNWNIGENLTATDTITMQTMFWNNRSFNQDLGGWDVSKVSSFLNTFLNNFLFEGIGLDQWNVSSTATTMQSMFYNCYVFNQDLSDWDVSAVTTFNQMLFGLNGTMAFNNGATPGVVGTGLQNWNIGANVANGTTINMSRMFRNNISFNQDLTGWDVTKVTVFSETFFDCHLFEGLGTPTWQISGSNTDPVVMNNMFGDARVFNQPLASWETAAGSTMAYVTNTSSMFNLALIFNQVLGDWDVGRVVNFSSMFQSTNAYNDPTINNWNISENTGTTAINMSSVFSSGNAFNHPLDGWQTNADSTMEYVTNMQNMFANADFFNQNLRVWNVGRVINFSGMFWRSASPPTAYNNGDATGVVGTGLQDWNIGANLTSTQTITMLRMFKDAEHFNQDLSGWDVTRVNSFQETFAGCGRYEGFGIPTWQISGANTHNVTMRSMFSGTPIFNQPLSIWETDPGSTMAYVFDIAGMFSSSITFNQSLGDWNVGRVRDFFVTFTNARAFEDLAPSINNWNISENTGTAPIIMLRMFEGATIFNSSLSGWETNANSTMAFVSTMERMFNNTPTFNQSLAAWTPIATSNFSAMLNNSDLSVANYDATLTSWAQQDLQDNQVLGAANLEFCSAEPFRASLVADQGWTITGDILGCAPGNVSGSGALLYWVTAGSHIGADGGPVEEWLDISGDGRTFSQTTAANQPTFLNNTTDAVNFNPLIDFDGTDDYIEGFDFNLHDLSFPNTPRIDLPIVGRTATSELSVTFTVPGDLNPTTATHTAALSVLGGDVNSYFPVSWRPANEPTSGANTTEYLELDLGEVVPLSTIRTQGEGSNRRGNNWVETYTVHISTDGTNFTQVDGTFTGNVNRLATVLNEFSESFPAQYVRIYPQTWSGAPALRVGVGTKGYVATSSFLIAIEDVRQDNVTQSLNHIDTNNRLDISVANGSGNTTANNSFTGDNSIDLSAAVPALNNKPFLINYTATGNGEAKLYRDGIEIANDDTTPRYILMGTNHLGGLPTGNYFNGKIAETSLFSIEPTQDQRERINTYFAIKYNIPIIHNFVYQDLSDNMQTLWDVTANAAYNNDIFGLGIDSNQGLNQRVSTTREDDDKVLTAATINNFTSLNSDPTRNALTGEGSFVIMGNDDGAATFSPNGAPNKFHILDRKWFAQVTGDAQPLFFEFNVGLSTFDVATPSQTTDYFFITDSNGNGDLTDETPLLMVNTTGDLWSTPTPVTISNGQLFTMAVSFTTNPGGVAQDLTLWLKADAENYTDGNDITIWTDQTINSGDMTPQSVARTPNFISTTDNVNFNPYIDFDRTTSDRLNGANYGLTGAPDYQMYFVYNHEEAAANTFPDLWDWDGINGQERIEVFSDSFRNGTSADAPEGTWHIGVAGATGGILTARANGLSGTSTGSFFGPIDGNGNVSIGTNGELNANIAEIIYYTTEDSAINRQKIESYLALKYGITLDQTTATDYVSSGSTPTIIWDSAVDTAYKSDIFGIGRDDAGGLNQKVSKSANANTIFTVSMDGDDFAKSNNVVVNGHTNDLQFLSFANNGLDTEDQITELDTDNYNLGTNREWQIYKTANFTDAVNLKFEGFAGYDVIQSTDNDFSTDGDQTVLGTLDANGELTNVTGLVSGSYLGLAKFQLAPGGVVVDLSLWLKADGAVYNTVTTQATDGQTVATWTDNSINQNHGIEATNQPDFRNNATDNINFNPVIDFNGNDDQLVLDPSYFVEGNAARSYIAVGLPNTGSPTNNHPVLDHGNAGTGRSSLTLSATSVSTSTGESNYIGTHAVTTPFIGSATLEGGAALENYIFRTNASTLSASGSGSILVPNTINTSAYVGRLTNPVVASYGGKIAEIIAYNGDINANTIGQKQIESYLALKYGITLDASIADYVNTAGVSVYDLASYNNDVFGIANDAPQALNQEISKSVNMGAILTLSTDTDFTASNGLHTPLNDGQYLVIGNDGANGSIPASQNTTDLDTSKYFNRVAREWKSINTETVGEVHLQFDGFDQNWVVLTRTADGDFSATTGTTETQLSASGTVALTLPATSYFTLAQKPISIEFEATTASDLEATGANLPNLLINGALTANATIDVVVNAAGTATANTDYTLGSVTGDAAATITATIPAGVYTSATPVALSSLSTSIVNQLTENYSEIRNNGTVVNHSETFVAPTSGNYQIILSAGIVNSGNGRVRVGTTSQGFDAFDGWTDRIDATTPSKTYNFPLVGGTTYYVFTDAGGGGDMENIEMILDYKPLLNFTITDEALVENNETISLSLSNPQNGLEVNNVTGSALIDTHVYTITNDDTATVTIAADADAIETTSARAFTVTMSKVASVDIDVSYTLTGTAANPADYADNTTVVGTVTIPAGSTTATIDLTVVDDTKAELTETVIATLTAVTDNTAVTASTTPATLNITDDDLAALTISIGSTADGTEGSSDITYTVSLDNGVTNETGTAITGTLALTGTAANGTDYTDLTSFSIADGATSATITVSVTDDSEVEISETVIATISSPSVGSIGTATATANILDDDLTALSISIGALVDGTEGSTDITYTVSLDSGVTNETGTAITGTIVLTGTATNGTDYTDITSFSIADGASSASITVNVTDDSEVEISETVIATISNPSIGSIGTAEATANIADDDLTALTISIGSPVDAIEGTNDISYIVSLDNDVTNNTGSPITGTLALTGTATNGSDYTDVTSFSIADGASSASISVSITDDSEIELSETVIATITTPNVGTINNASATAIIIDNDTATITIVADDDADESISSRAFTLTMNKVALTNVAVDYVLTGSALNPDDYTDVSAVAGTIIIPVGETTATIAIEVVNDNFIESDETITATLAAETNTTVVSASTESATLTIINDDEIIVSVIEDITTDESVEEREFLVALEDVAAVDVVLEYTFSGTALISDDYTDISGGSITIPAGTTVVPIPITIIDDLIEEEDEEITISLSSQMTEISFVNTSATMTIIDNDECVLNCDTDGDGDCDFNCDCDADGIADGDSCGQVGSISTITVATAFTPNGDGINDTWVIDGIENHPNSVAKVYNRWSHEVFSAKGYQNDWDANYNNNSRKLPQGSYYYVIDLGEGSIPQDGWIFINY